MEKEELKQKIRDKFGTLSNFARCAGMDRYELQKQLVRPDLAAKEITRLHGICRSTKAKESDIRVEQLETLKVKISGIGGVDVFCSEHPSFSRASVFQIISGRRKVMSKGVRKLFDHFQIE